jgi:hypothetical protein
MQLATEAGRQRWPGATIFRKSLSTSYEAPRRFRLGEGVEPVSFGLRLLGLLAGLLGVGRERRNPPLLLPRPVDGDDDERDEQDREHEPLPGEHERHEPPERAEDRQPDHLGPDHLAEESGTTHRIIIPADFSSTRGRPTMG